MPEGLKHSGRVAISPDLMVQRLPDGRAVCLYLKSDEYFGFDEVGTSIWAALEAGCSIEETYRQLFDRFDVDPDQLRRDLDGFVSQLVEFGFIRLDG